MNAVKSSCETSSQLLPETYQRRGLCSSAWTKILSVQHYAVDAQRIVVYSSLPNKFLPSPFSSPKRSFGTIPKIFYLLYSKSHPIYAVTWAMWMIFQSFNHDPKVFFRIGFTDRVIPQKVMPWTRDESEQTVHIPMQTCQPTKLYRMCSWWGLVEAGMKQESQEDNMTWEKKID